MLSPHLVGDDAKTIAGANDEFHLVCPKVQCKQADWIGYWFVSHGDGVEHGWIWLAVCLM